MSISESNTDESPFTAIMIIAVAVVFSIAILGICGCVYVAYFLLVIRPRIKRLREEFDWTNSPSTLNQPINPIRNQ